jgi:MarR family transcriptional regulator, organic hydroperoxide resistance regulator
MIYDVAEHLPTDSGPAMQMFSDPGIVAREGALIRRFGWEIVAISLHLDRLHGFQAHVFGISVPQFKIIATLAHAGAGMPVTAVSRVLHVAPSFVTTQSKALEKKGLVCRQPSVDDARIVNMSLTAKTHALLSALASQQRIVDDFISVEFGSGELEALTGKLAVLKRKLEKACLKVAADVEIGTIPSQT